MYSIVYQPRNLHLLEGADVVALSLNSWSASLLLLNAVARHESVIEVSVPLVTAIVRHDGGILVRAGCGHSQQTGEHDLHVGNKFDASEPSRD